MAGSMGTFNNVWYSFLSTPVYDPAKAPPDYTPHPPFTFTGGLGLPPRSVGFAMAILGSIGITMQLFIYLWSMTDSAPSALGEFSFTVFRLFIFLLHYSL
jgi:hypothetical protein